MRRSLAARTGSVFGGRQASFGETLASLHENLKKATRFLDPWNQFHDEVVTSDEIRTAGHPADSPRLTGLLAAAATKLLPRRHEPTGKHYLHVPEYGFWHGMCEIGPYSVIFFFFDEGELGLAGFSKSLLDDNIELIRFTPVDVPPGTMPVLTRGQS